MLVSTHFCAGRLDRKKSFDPWGYSRKLRDTLPFYYRGLHRSTHQSVYTCTSPVTHGPRPLRSLMFPTPPVPRIKYQDRQIYPSADFIDWWLLFTFIPIHGSRHSLLSPVTLEVYPWLAHTQDTPLSSVCEWLHTYRCLEISVSMWEWQWGRDVVRVRKGIFTWGFRSQFGTKGRGSSSRPSSSPTQVSPPVPSWVSSFWDHDVVVVVAPRLPSSETLLDLRDPRSKTEKEVPDSSSSLRGVND